MKRLITFLLIATFIVSVFPMQIAYASQDYEILDVIEYEDGSYLEISIQSLQTRASGSLTKTKNYTYHNGDGASAWKISLTGSFTYTGTSATCTASSCNVTIYDSKWSIVSKSASKSGNTAYGTATLSRNLLGVSIDKKTCNLTLTCDKNGNVS